MSVFSMMRSYVWWLRTIQKRIIWSASGAEASPCQDALDLTEYTRAIWYQVVFGGEALPDEWKERHDYRLQELA